jgi:hypothetical protein
MGGDAPSLIRLYRYAFERPKENTGKLLAGAKFQ